MQPLKKYFTEGLIQVAIVLSLAGMHVDVDPYLSPSQNINVQSPYLTQTLSSNLQNSAEGCGVHMKSPDVETSVPVPRLLHWVRSLEHLQMPTSQLEAWLVHSESDNSRMTIPSLSGSWDGADELVDMEDSAGLTVRMGGGGGSGELVHNPLTDDGNFGVVTTLSRSQMDSEGIKEEADEFSIWQQDPNQNIHQDHLLPGQNQHFSLLNEDDEDEFIVDSWQHASPFRNPVSSIRGDVQFIGSQEGNSLSAEECLQLLDAGFSLGHDHYLEDLDPMRAEEDQMQHYGSLFSPLLPHEPMLDLEQQWQDVLSVLEPQDTNANDLVDSSHLNERRSSRETGILGNPTQQNLSLHHSSFPSLSEISANNTDGGKERCLSTHNDNPFNGSDSNLHLKDTDIIDLLLSNSPSSSNVNIPIFSMEETSQLSLFDPLMKESLLYENGLLDVTMENGSGESEVFKKEDQSDSDSGLSLDYSQSPVSPSRSESSCSSSTSSSSSSSISSAFSGPEEGAVGYTHIKQEPIDEEGAVGGYTPEQHKICYTNYLPFQYSPWPEHIDHDHTYNQPQYTNQGNSPISLSKEPLEYKHRTRDEKRAHAMRIPFSTDHIINLPVEEFNELLAKHHLSEAQLTLIRDIRRRGKNKVAAQNCRRRKMDILQDLEHSVNGLRRHRARLLREKSEVLHSVREMKQRLNDLYREVRSRYREVDRIPCSAMDFALHSSNDSHVTNLRRKSSKKQKDKE